MANGNHFNHYAVSTKLGIIVLRLASNEQAAEQSVKESLQRLVQTIQDGEAVDLRCTAKEFTPLSEKELATLEIYVISRGIEL